MPSAEAQRAELFDLAPCGLLLLDADYSILSCNGYFAELTGRSHEELQGGMKFHALLSAAGRIFVQTRLQQELALAGHQEEMALDIVRPDGARVPVMLNASQSPDADGRPGRIRMAVWRAVAKRAYEAEVPKARQAAAEAAQVKADFLANVGHELRTPLNSVVGLAGVLASTDLDARQQEMVEMIGASGVALERIIADILDLSKVQAGRLSLEVRPFELVPEITGVLERARLRAEEKGLGFEARIAPDAHGRFVGDAVRVKQILEHLTSNAVKFTETGGVTVRIDADDEAIQLEVSDTGIGFDEAAGAVLFNGFGQADGAATRKFGGAGLGLSICKGLAELMGGTIAARSRPGEGSVFSVRLPLPRPAAAAPIAAAEPQPEPEDAQERSLRVLVVEDNPTNQRVVELILGQLGVELEMADDGRKGVDAWARGGFDLVLMDMQMPVMDGLAAIREIRRLEGEAKAARTPIAMLSANAMEHHRAQAMRAGADLHLAKPITPQALVEGVQAALEAAARAA